MNVRGRSRILKERGLIVRKYIVGAHSLLYTVGVVFSIVIEILLPKVANLNDKTGEKLIFPR